MRIRFSHSLLTLLLLAVVARPALAQAITVDIALDPSVGGTVLSAGSAVISGVPATINETAWTDSHSKNAPLFAGDVSFPVAPRVEVLAGAEFGHESADIVTVGTVPGGSLSASFDAYQFWGLEGGVRVGLRRGNGAYGIFTGGFRRVSDINAIFTGPGVAANRPVYDNSMVPAFGFGGGYLFGYGTGFGVGIEVEVKYAGSLKAAAASPELAAVADAGKRWSLPIGLVVRF